MRRKTTALTATIAGATLAVVIPAWAQQSPQPATSGRVQPATAPEPEPVPSQPRAAMPPAPTVVDPRAAAQARDNTVYGIGVSRGARHLVRNGLDYIAYQEYDRALKYFREAEARQAELTPAEKLLLKQGIESAQRGLREAVGAKAPYAASRKRRPGGFAVAQNKKQAQARVLAAQEAATAGRTVADVDKEPEPQGDPIRLASGAMAEGAKSDIVRAANPPRDARAVAPADAAAEVTTAAVAALSSRPQVAEAAPPAQLPDIGKLATAAETPATKPQPPATRPEPGPSPGPGDNAKAAQADLQSPLPALDPAAMPAAGIEPATTPKATTPPPAEAKPAAETAPDVAAPALPTIEAAAPTATDAKPPAAPASIAQPETRPEPAPAPAPIEAPAPIKLETIAEPVEAPAPPKEEAKAAPAIEAAEAAPQPAPAAVPNPADLVPAAITAEPVTPPKEEAKATPKEEAKATPKEEAKADVEATPAAGTEETNDDELPPLPSGIAPGAEPAARPAAIEAPATEMKPELAPATEERATPVPIPVPASEDRPNSTEEALPPLPADDGERLPPLPAEAEAAPTGPAEKAGASAPTGPDSPGVAPAAQPIAAETPAATPEVQPASEAPASAPAAEPAPARPATDPVPVGDPVAEQPPASPADEPPAAPAEAVRPSDTQPEATETMPLSTGGGVVSKLGIPQRANPVSGLSDEQKREVEQIARQQDEILRRRQMAPPAPGARGEAPRAPASDIGLLPKRGDGTNDYGNQSQVDISRAPSPAEARPIHAIPVPEDYVPLAPRDWSPQRKYWSAAGTCHMPLYFQDAALERYGHSVEQFLGPAGRFFSYPVDDPTQSTQRNQMLQSVFSVGLFAAQIVALPYNLVMDPPWEAEYDLGYYRPGDRIPTDVYYLPLHGVGPPLKGKSY